MYFIVKIIKEGESIALYYVASEETAICNNGDS
jgi:hypothetical protein